jgi:dihydroorotate dehydrogenase
MSWLYRNFVRPALFLQDPEEIHERTMRALAWAGRNEILCRAVESFLGSPSLESRLFGLRFPNPVGLAAGMDKAAVALPAWEALGFGFTELGAVTWHAQPGNTLPRVFRATKDEAIINRMGFNNPGAEAVSQTLAEWRSAGRWPNHPVGINLGKSKVTPLEKAPADYANSFRVLLPHLDFFVINVSSPNTPNLRQLQDKAALDEILAAVQEIQSPRSQVGSSESTVHSPQSTVLSSEVQGELAKRTPILVKVAPDLSFEALDQILELVGPRQVAGIIATNTTIARPEASLSELKRVYAEAGGLSGRPLRARSTEVVQHLYKQTKGKLPIIGVGGIFNAADAWEKITAGASLVQVYTGLVYNGPGMARNIVSGLLELLEKNGMRELHQAVGMAMAPA